MHNTARMSRGRLQESRSEARPVVKHAAIDSRDGFFDYKVGHGVYALKDRFGARRWFDWSEGSAQNDKDSTTDYCPFYYYTIVSSRPH